MSIYDYACEQKNTNLQAVVREILDWIPLDIEASFDFRHCFTGNPLNQAKSSEHLRKFMFAESPAYIFYHLKATMICLLSSIPLSFQEMADLNLFFIESSGLKYLFEILMEPDIIKRLDVSFKISIYSMIFHLLKRYLTVLCIYQTRLNNDQEELAAFLESMPLTTIPNENRDLLIFEKSIADSLIKLFKGKAIPAHCIPNYTHIREIIRLTWFLASNAHEDLYQSDFKGIHEHFQQQNVS